jgi:hypothetical protein
VNRTASARPRHRRARSGQTSPPRRISARPRPPMNRSPVQGWSTMPSTGPSPASSPISTPHEGAPARKARVPSIGSRTQVRPDRPATGPNSSPRTPSSGRRAATMSRIARSASRSASVTGSNQPPKPLSSQARVGLRNSGRQRAAAASAIASAVSHSRPASSSSMSIRPARSRGARPGSHTAPPASMAAAAPPLPSSARHDRPPRLAAPAQPRDVRRERDAAAPDCTQATSLSTRARSKRRRRCASGIA